MYHRMWGAATHDRSTGVHRPLFCTALVLAPASSAGKELAQSQVIVSLDHCLMWNDDLEQMVATICQSTGLAPAQMQIALTHTHAAGLLDSTRSDLPGGELIGRYLAQLADRAAEAVREALARLTPAIIVYSTGHCALATQRDFWDEASRQFVCGFNPAGDADDTLLLARVTRANGEMLATVVNYACHPTTLAWDNTLISPDFIGALRETVEAVTDGAPCLFLQGASGDLGPRRGFVGDVETADRNGRELGYAALSTLQSMPPAGTAFEYAGPVISGATIGTWRDRPLTEFEQAQASTWQTRAVSVPLPYRDDLPSRELSEEEMAHWIRTEAQALEQGNPLAARDARAQIERMARQLRRLRLLPAGESVPLRATVWRLGGALWVFVAGEHYQYLQRTLRAKFPQVPVIISTVTNGWLPGYLPTHETYGRGIYQESIAIVAPGALEQFTEAIAAEFESLI
jgi:hypothetical protein